MTHTASHVIVSKAKAFAKANYKSVLACVASFVLGALLF